MKYLKTLKELSEDRDWINKDQQQALQKKGHSTYKPSRVVSHEPGRGESSYPKDHGEYRGFFKRVK